MILEVEGIHSGYGPIEILHGVSLCVKRSEIVSVIGPNGSGKSSTFKTIMGFLVPTSGRILFKGLDTVGLRPDEVIHRGLTYVPQGRIVFSDMTVLENLEMGGFIEKDKRKVRKSVEKVCELFPILKARLKQKAGTMSGGEQQMLAMARALMTDPALILLDEPSLGLAPLFVNMIFEKILELSRKTGMTLMIVEQNAAKALEVSDRAYALDLGRNRFQGTGKELLENEEVRRLYLGG